MLVNVFADESDYSCDDLKTVEIYAKNGDIEAQYYYSKCLLNIGKNKEAAYWMETGAKNAYEPAIIGIGHILYEGLKGVAKDEDKALLWYQAGAEKGNMWCYYYLGKHYAKDKRLKKAALLYEKAADKGHISSVVALMKYYASKKDHAKYEYWFNIAKEAGYDDNNRLDPNKW